MWSRPLALAGLMVLAAWINLNAPTVFFDSQLMLGTSVAVLALLLFGWRGLLVGAAALLVTVARWGHPFELLIGLGQLVWLRWFLDHLNGGRSQQANGRLVLAAIGYWLVIGIPAELVLFTQRLGVDLIKALGLGLKEAVTAVLSAAIGLVAYLLWRAWRFRGTKGQLCVRGITFAAVLLSVTLPGVLITLTLSGQLKDTALQAQHRALSMVADEVASSLADTGEPPMAPQWPEGVAVRWRNPQGVVLGSSNPKLFARLDQDFRREFPDRANVVGMDLLMPRQGSTVLEDDEQAYWRVRNGLVSVVQPAQPLIRRLDYELMFPSFTLLGLLLLLAAAVAELLATAVERQFLEVIRPLQDQPNADQLPDLGSSAICELQQLVELVNHRTRRTRELSFSLQQARDELAQSALAITEAIPVGTYTMVLRPGDYLSRFSFVSQRFLDICGVDRQTVMADSLQAFAHVHPDDKAVILALNAEACTRKIPFRAECRLELDGEIRWVKAESLPRTLADGSTLWEGVLTDVTERKRAEAALAQAFRRETELKEQQRLELEGKLRTSLTAAAVAHEINQPLSAILINAQMLQAQLQALPEGEAVKLLKPLLELQVSEVDRIVATIEKMRMLLRNVQTDPERIDLCEVVASAQLYLRSLLSSHGVVVEMAGFDQPQWLLGDGVQLQIAVANLIRNAVEALSQAGVTEPRLHLSLERCSGPDQPDWLELRLADNGPGFGDVQLEQLLLTSTKPRGSGIGLFVASTAAQNHGGSLALQRSQTLRGAEVVLRLPALP